MKTRYWVCIYILAMFFHLIIGWRLPLYAYMMCIDLPDDAIVIQQAVTVNDIGYWHILGETVFVSEQGYDNIREDIRETNKFLMETINLARWGMYPSRCLSEWDASGISTMKADEATARIGYHNWYCVYFEMLGLKQLRLYSCLSAIVSLAITTAVCIVLDKRMKKGKQKT